MIGQNLVVVYLLVAAAFGFAALLARAMEQQDVITCRALLRQQAEYPTFYSTPGEKEMCRALGIDLKK